MSEIWKPETEEQAADMIRSAFETATPLAIFGGNTRIGLGNPVHADVQLSSSALSGIVSYNPAEMVMTARAGTPVAEIEAALGAHGQYMAFEPADHRGIFATSGTPTIGGVFAANVSGPRRFALAGAARDHLLGVGFVNGTGAVVRSGGRVMKNVTGLDLVKLMAGSFGTLGLMSEVTFKVLPAPKTVATVIVRDLAEDEAIRAMAAAMALPVEVSGAAHLPYSVCRSVVEGRLSCDAATCFRLEGLVESVAVRCEKLTRFLGPYGAVIVLERADSTALWREIRDVTPYADGTEKPLWRVSVPPSAGASVVAAMRMHCAVDAFYDWQGGLIWMRMDAGPEDEFLRATVAHYGPGHARLVRADETARKAVSAFEPQSAALAALSARIKAKFDPRGILNPARMEKQERTA